MRIGELAKNAGVNVQTLRFYERHGFVQIWTGDGSDNDEGQPDVRLAWRPLTS